MDLIEDAMLEYEDIYAMLRQLMRAEIDEGGSWDELFEDMMQGALHHGGTRPPAARGPISRSVESGSRPGGLQRYWQKAKLQRNT